MVYKKSSGVCWPSSACSCRGRKSQQVTIVIITVLQNSQTLAATQRKNNMQQQLAKILKVSTFA